MGKNPSSQNQVAPKFLCIFCYKPFQEVPSCDPIDDHTSPSTPTLTERLQICDKFYSQLVIPSNPFQKKGGSQVGGGSQDGNTSKSDHTALQWSRDSKGICLDCFYAVNTHTKLFEKVALFQRRLRWQLDKLYNVMKSADKIPSRVQAFKDNMAGNKDHESVLKYRTTLFQYCAQKLTDIENWRKNFTSNAGSGRSASILSSPCFDRTNNSTLNITMATLSPSPNKMYVCKRRSAIPATPSKRKQETPSKQKPETPLKQKLATPSKRKRATPSKLKPASPSKRKPATPSKRKPIKIVDVCLAKPTKLQSQKEKTPRTDSLVIPSTSPGLPALFKCSKCPTKFSSLEALKDHSKKEHFVLKEEPRNDNGHVEDDATPMFACTVEITDGSKIEQMELNQYLNNDNTEDQPDNDSENSLSEYDEDVRRNYFKLMEIVKRLRPHRHDSDSEANQSSPIKRKKSTGGGPQRKILRKKAASPKILQKEAVSSKTLQKEAVPSKILQKDAVPSKILQKDAVPSKILQKDAVPSKILQKHLVPSKILQTEPVPSKISQQKTVPSKAFRKKAVPSKISQQKTVPSKAFRKKSVPRKIYRKKTVSRKTLQKKAAPRKIFRKEAASKKIKNVRKSDMEECKIRSVLCETCGQSFTATKMTDAETKLFLHLQKNRLHEGKAIWKHQCQICGKLCRFQSKLKQHQLTVHSRDTEKIFSCSHCPAKFFHKGHLISHFDSQHPDQIKLVEVTVRNKMSENSMSNKNATDGDNDENMGYIEPKLEAFVIGHEL